MIKLYTIGCPKCKILEMKLNEKKIKYEVETDINKMKELGIMSAPYLGVDDKLLNFSESIKYINEIEVK